MRMNLRNKKFPNFFLTMMLIVAMALTVAGCGKNKQEVPNPEPQSVEASDTVQQATDEQLSEDQPTEEQQPSDGQQSSEEAEVQSGKDDVTILGEGQTVIQFVVVDKDGNETAFEIHTDKETVGDALLEHDLIAGDESEYGLYVKQVNGITADYDVDQTYWAFYINGEYAMTGVDSTAVTEGETYTFKVEK